MDIRPCLESYSLSLDMALILPMLEGFGQLVLSPSKYEQGGGILSPLPRWERARMRVNTVLHAQSLESRVRPD